MSSFSNYGLFVGQPAYIRLQGITQPLQIVAGDVVRRSTEPNYSDIVTYLKLYVHKR